MLFDAHNHAFRVFGGVPQRGNYDNMRTAVDKIGRGKQRQVSVARIGLRPELVDRIQHLMPTPNSGDDFIRVGGPDEGL